MSFAPVRTARRVALVPASLLALACGDASAPAAAPWLSVSAGAHHTCALAATHRAWCWGRNIHGALGDGTTQDRLVPVAVAGGRLFDSLSAGLDYTCALASGGAAWCWGENFNGQLGDGSMTHRLTPVAVVASGFRSISAGEAHTCGLTASATLCWGAPLSRDASGNLPPPRALPTPLAGPAFAAISSGFEIACGLTAPGEPYCWGLFAPGIALPDTSQHSSSDPVAVRDAGVRLASIGAGTKHACGLTAGGQAWCWGLNSSGQLGTGTTTSAPAPEPVSGGIVFARLDSRGPNHDCGVTADGTGYCWGDNTLGQLGIGAGGRSTVPAPVAGGHAFHSISAGFYHSCGITTDGRAWCWGHGGFGQLGTGDSTGRREPAEVSDIR